MKGRVNDDTSKSRSTTSAVHQPFQELPVRTLLLIQGLIVRPFLFLLTRLLRSLSSLESFPSSLADLHGSGACMMPPDSMADPEEPTMQRGESGVMNNNLINKSETASTDPSDGTKVEDATTAAPADPTLSDNVLKTTHSASAQLQLITDSALRFLSHASNETIGACLVGLGATTYLVLGRVGLMLIGLVGGIALHASWDAHGESDRVAAREKELRKKRELGLEVVQRVFQWRSEKSFAGDDSEGEEQEVKILSKRKLDFSAFRPNTALALGNFTDAIIRDYVKYAHHSSPTLHTH